MDDEGKTRGQLIRELAEMRQRVAELEALEARRRQAEEAQQESEARLKATIESLPFDFFALDANGRYALQNSVCRKRWGDLIGKRPEDLPVDEDVVALWLDNNRRALSGEMVEGEITYTFGDKQEVHYNVFAPIRYGDRIHGVVGINMDITERKQANEALRQRTAQLGALREISLELTAQLDLDVLLRSVVSRAVELLGGTSGGLYLYRPERDVLEWVVATESGLAPIGTILHRGEGLSGKILETGKPLIVDNYQSWEGRAAVYNGHPLASVVGVPVRWGPPGAGGDFLGVLNVSGGPTRTFSSADVELLSLFASHAAIAIRNVQLYEEARRRAMEQETVNRIARALNTLDIRQAFPVLVEGLRDIAACDRVSLALLDVTNEHFITSILEPPFPALGEGVVVPLSATAAAEDLMMRLPHLTADLGTEINFPVEQELYRAGFRSRISLPLSIGSNVLGALHLMARQTGLYSRGACQSRLPVLRQIADALASAIENSRLFHAEQRQRQEANTLRETALVLTTALDLDDVIERILAQLQKVVPYDSSSVQLLRGDRLEIVGGRGFPNLPELLGISFPIGGDNPNTQVVRARAPFIVADSPVIYGDFRRPPHAQAGIRSWLGVPMLVGERLVGMIALDKREPGFYTPAHARLAEAFAAQAAIAIENARLFQAEREQREMAEALAEAAAAISSTLDPDQVLDRILEQMERVIAGEAFNFMLIEGDLARVVRRRGYERLGVEALAEIPPIPITDYPNLVRMMQTGEAVLVQDTMTDPDWVLREGREWLRSYVGAPIRVEDLTVGFLNVNGTRPGQFGPADARRLEAFASQAAIAIQNAQLHRELLDHAEQLEQRVRERTAQLAAQHARLEAILYSTTDGIIVTDAEGEILQANPVAQAWLTQTLSPEDADRLREMVREIAARAEERAIELLELTGLDLELSGAPILEPWEEELRQPPQSEPQAMVVIHDVSHLKALDRMKTRFITNISHEFRTPITTIKLYAHLMQRHPERWRQYLDVLVQEADHQAQLVEDILQISRIDAGRIEMKPRPTPLNELAETVITSRQAMAQERGLRLEHHPADPGPTALVDPDRMMQVLNSLVTNAIRYTPEGGVVVVSTGMQRAKGRVWATVTVADTGIGIPHKELPHIFERFFRGEKPRMMQWTGTGLGLAIVQEIVELHGGRVTVESEEGAGSTFTVGRPASMDTLSPA